MRPDFHPVRVGPRVGPGASSRPRSGRVFLVPPSSTPPRRPHLMNLETPSAKAEELVKHGALAMDGKDGNPCSWRPGKSSEASAGQPQQSALGDKPNYPPAQSGYLEVRASARSSSPPLLPPIEGPGATQAFGASSLSRPSHGAMVRAGCMGLSTWAARSGREPIPVQPAAGNSFGQGNLCGVEATRVHSRNTVARGQPDARTGTSES